MIQFRPKHGFVAVIVCALLTVSSTFAGANEASESAASQKRPSLEKVVQNACNILVGNQENYTADRPVGRLPDKELKGWQEKERERLAKVRKESKGAAEWPYEGVYRIRPDGRIPPGYRVGGSAIVCEALLESPKFRGDRREAVLRSVRFMLHMIDNDTGMKSSPQKGYDVRGWGQAYALKFFVRALETDLFKGHEKLRGHVEKTIPHLISCLKAGQVRGGGWNYAGRSISPFMTGSTLIALYRAAAAGYDVDEEMISAALDALEAGRREGTAYAYSGTLRNPDEPMQGASARTAIAELALFRGGRSDVDRLRKAIDGFFNEENWKELLKRKSQQGTHVKPYGVAPYYFFYGHTYAALAVEHLPKKERSKYRKKMQELLWRTIEPHGGWNDRIFPRTESYSTAMAVLSLIARDLPEVPTWGGSGEKTAEGSSERDSF